MFFANFLISLREGVEAALIVGILAAGLVASGRRDLLRTMWIGVVVAAALPLLAGAFMTFGPYTLSFQASEIIGGTLSLLAAGFVTWMTIWMTGHGADVSRRLREQVSRGVASDHAGITMVWIAALAVGREGLETAIFVWATVKASSQGGALAPTAGVICGLVVAIAIGWALYTGALRMNLSAFFTITSIFLVFVAAGIAAYGVGDLQEAGVLPGWGIAAYDLTSVLGDQFLRSVWYVLLEAVINFNPAPTLLQVATWWIYLIVSFALLWRSRRAAQQAARTRHTATQQHAAAS